MNRKTISPLPWYRHRWPWLLMLGPFLVIVAAAITLWLALRSNDGLVADDYYKQGLAVNQVTSRDRQAETLQVSGDISIDTTRQMVRVALRSGKLASPPAVLALNLSHPTRSGLDQSLRLQRDASNAPGMAGYSAGLTGELAGRWNVVLEDEAREWRLTGSWDILNEPVLTLPKQAR